MTVLLRTAAVGSVTLMTLLSPIPAAAQEPTPLVGAKIRGLVSVDAGTKIFTYEYRVDNPVANTSSIGMVKVSLNQRPDEEVLSSIGLANGPRYMASTSEGATREAPMVPVGLSGPERWLVGLGSSAAVVVRGWAGWGAADVPDLIRPGQRLGGFLVRSPGLPALRDGALLVDIDPDKLPDEYIGDIDRTRALRQRTTSEVSTIGPKAPPKHFVAIEYVNYLLAMVYESGRQRWISNPNDEAKLVRRLRDAKRRLEAGQLAHAAKRVQQFLREAEHEACWEFECSGRKGLTSEATALFVFNARYLLERLPPPTAEDVPD